MTWLASVLDNIRQDVALAVRSLAKDRTFSVVAVLTLAAGIGAAATVFAAFHGVLLRGLPVAHEDRLVLVRKEQPQDGTLVPFGYADLRALREKTQLVDDVAGVQYDGAFPWVVVEGDQATSLMGTLVSGEFFRVLGARAALGRLLEASEAVNGVEPVVVISYSLWKGRFGGNPGVLGRWLRINGEMHTVVGVAPKDFEYPPGVELWLPTPPIIMANGHELRPFSLLVLLRPGLGLAEARAEISGFVREREMLDRPGEARGRRATLLPLREVIVGSIRAPMFALSIAVALVLMIAVVNVVALLLVRGVERQRELSIRSALGAGRRRLLGQLLVESAVLAAAAVMVGLLLAHAGTRGLLLIAPPDLPRIGNVELSVQVFAFAAVVAVAATLVLGVASGLAVTRVDLAMGFLRSTAVGRPHRRHLSGKETLVGLQIALALLVAVGAGLLTKSLGHMQRVDLGFDAAELTLVRLDLPFNDTTSSEQHHLLLKELSDRLVSGGVSDATPVLMAPFSGRGGWDAFYTVEGQGPAEAAANPGSNFEPVMPNYFRTLAIPILRGRGFSLDDRQGALPIVVVSQAFARRAWPGRDPLGKRIKFGSADGPGQWQTVVGVAGDVRYRDLLTPPPTLYVPLLQTEQEARWLLIRTRPGVPVARRAIQTLATELAPASLVLSVTPVSQLLAQPLARPKFLSSLVAAFASLALLLAGVGLYGVMTSITAARTRELGIRMALGAGRGRIRRLVMRQGAMIAVLGLGLGFALAGVTTRWLRALLYDVNALDIATLVIAALSVLSIMAAASYLPAHRATKVDPTIALRSD